MKQFAPQTIGVVGVGVGVAVIVADGVGVGVGVGVSASAIWPEVATKKAVNTEIIPLLRRFTPIVGVWRLGWNTAQA